MPADGILRAVFNFVVLRCANWRLLGFGATLLFDLAAPTLAFDRHFNSCGLATAMVGAALLAQLACWARDDQTNVDNRSTLSARLLLMTLALSLGLGWHRLADGMQPFARFVFVWNCVLAVYGCVTCAIALTETRNAVRHIVGRNLGLLLGTVCLNVAVPQCQPTSFAVGVLLVALLLGVSTAANALVLQQLTQAIRFAAERGVNLFPQHMGMLLTATTLETVIVSSFSGSRSWLTCAATALTFLAAKGLFVALVLSQETRRWAMESAAPNQSARQRR